MENWRKYLLTESIDSKIMKQIDKAQKMGYVVHVNSGGSTGSVEILTSEGGHPAAKVEWEYVEGQHGNCNNASVVELAKSDQGLGPLAYDVAIEKTGGLISDRTTVSSDARAVWDHYLNNRSDVEAVQLDDPFNSLTPEDEDNCDQEVAGGGHTFYGGDKDFGSDWVKSPLSKVYKKSGTPVMDELEKRGMLKVATAEGRDFQKDSSYIKDHAGNKEKLIGVGGQDNSEPYEKNPIKKRSKSAPPAG